MSTTCLDTCLQKEKKTPLPPLCCCKTSEAAHKCNAQSKNSVVAVAEKIYRSVNYDQVWLIHLVIIMFSFSADKKMFWAKAILVVFSILLTTTKQTEALVEEALDIIKLGKEVTVSILETWEVIEQTQGNNDGDLPFYNRKEKKILARMNELSRQIDTAEFSASSSAVWTIEKINENQNLNTQLQLNLHELGDLINRIATQQNLMRTFAEHTNDLEHSTLENFVLWIVSPGNNAIQGLLDRIHLLVTGSPDLKAIGSNGVLQLINNYLEVSADKICGIYRPSVMPI